jgi:5'-nucleotidase
VVALAAVLLPVSLSHAEARPRILVTNDDGIHAPGLRALAGALRQIGEVTVLAPDTNRTAMSMASLIDVQRSSSGTFEAVTNYTLTTVKEAGGAVSGHALDLSPGDCVLLGLEGVAGGGPFDFVVSGINASPNLGRLWVYTSGTVGAAALATCDPKWDVRAIAIAQERGAEEADFALAADVARQTVQRMRAEGFPKGVLLSINVPGNATGVVVAPLGPGLLLAPGPLRVDPESGAFRPSFALQETLIRAPGTDYHAHFAQRKIVLTPLRVFAEDTNLFAPLGRWSFRLDSTNAISTAALKGTAWTLIELEGVAVTVTPGRAVPTLTLDAAAPRASGHSGINRYFGSYELDGAALRFGPMAGTRMAGPPEAMTAESAYLKALSAVTSWRVEGRLLELRGAVGVLLRFKGE